MIAAGSNTTSQYSTAQHWKRQPGTVRYVLYCTSTFMHPLCMRINFHPFHFTCARAHRTFTVRWDNNSLQNPSKLADPLSCNRATVMEILACHFSAPCSRERLATSPPHEPNPSKAMSVFSALNLPNRCCAIQECLTCYYCTSVGQYSESIKKMASRVLPLLAMLIRDLVLRNGHATAVS